MLAQDERGVQTATTYNPQDQVKTITRNSGDMNPASRRTAVYYYNDQGDVSAIDPPAGSPGRVQFDYRQYNQMDGSLYTNGSAYPNGVYLARLGKVTYVDGRKVCYGYNAAGELIWERKGDGGIITITRDKQHRIATIAYPANGSTAAFTVTRSYDEFGRPKQTIGPDGTTDFVWDSLNRPAHTILPAPQDSIDFSYQPDTTLHRWTSTMNVSNLGVWQYSLDSKGRLLQVTNSFAQRFQTGYNLDGTISQRNWPNGVSEQRAYNARGFLAQIQINQPGVTPAKQFNYSYGYSTGSPPDYDGTGHIRREIDEHGNLTHAFFFDNLYQLIGESGPGLGPGSLSPPYDVNYSFDLNGNRIMRSQGNATDYYGVDAADRLIWVNRGVNAAPTSGQALPYSLFYWDQDDALIARDRRDYNLVQQTLFFWHDGAGDLRKVTTSNSPSASPFFDALYNADGIRVEKDDTRAGVLTQNNFSYSPFGLLWSSNPNTVYTPGFGHRSNGVYSFYQQDWLGSTRLVTDINGAATASQSYEAWGSRDQLGPGSPNWPTDMQFGGAWGYQTEYSNLPNEPGLGLDYLQQRYYDPVVGRFMEPDPLGLAAGTNLFEYADDDPVNGVDPLGLAPDKRWVEPERGDQLPVDEADGIVYQPPARGLAPRDVDGNPIELHHRDQRPEGPVDEITVGQHRRNGNQGRLHGNPESEVCHGKEWEKWKREYWREQWDKGRFKNLPGGPVFHWRGSPDGIEPDESFDLFLLWLFTRVLPPEVETFPVPDEPPPVQWPAPDPTRIPVPAF